MIPEGWSPTSLGDCVVFKSGGTPSKQKPEYWGGDLPWVSAKDLKTHRISTAIDTLTDQGAANAKIAETSSILMLVRGMTLLKDVPIGLVTEPVAFNQDLKALISNDEVDPVFLSYLLVGKKLALMGLVNTANHGTGRLDTNLIKALPINLPPLLEQKKIAEILGTWDEVVEVAKKQLENAKTQKRALMQQLLTGKRRFPEFEGQEWNEVRASEIFRTVSIKRNENESLLAVTQDQGILLRDELERRVVMPEGSVAGYKLVVPGNFVISLRSFQGGLEYSNIRGLVSPAYHVLEPIIDIADSFFKHYFKSYQFIGRLAVAIIGIRDGKQISYSDFSFLKFPFPSLAEQKTIGKCLDVCQANIDEKANHLDCLQTEKKALMQQLLTGKKRVKV